MTVPYKRRIAQTERARSDIPGLDLGVIGLGAPDPDPDHDRERGVTSGSPVRRQAFLRRVMTYSTAATNRIIIPVARVPAENSSSALKIKTTATTVVK